MIKGRDVLSILDFTVEELEELFSLADEMSKYAKSKVEMLNGYVLATAFFEPSTRTRLSFKTAMLRLGGQVIDLEDMSASSMAKGENFADTVRMLDAYSNIIVIRHGLEGAARFAAEIAESPVINAGDGSRTHPTQAMIDLYTIKKELGELNGLTVGVLGDLKYGRAANSFINGISKFRVKKIFLISPTQLRLRPETKEHLREIGVNFYETSDLSEVISELDVLYVTRIQRERFPDPAEYEAVKGSYRLTLSVLKEARSHLIILHPLPRVDEIDFEVDGTKYAKYFEQASYGVPVRMALLKLILKG